MRRRCSTPSSICWAGRAARRWSASAAFGGAQVLSLADQGHDAVDFSTGSVGLGVGADPLRRRWCRITCGSRSGGAARPPGRMIALIGRCRARRGQCLRGPARRLEARCPQSLVDHRLQPPEPRRRGQRPPVPADRGLLPHRRLAGGHAEIRQALEAAFAGPGGAALRRLDRRAAPTHLYSALTFKGGAGWRQRLQARSRPATAGHRAPCSPRTTMTACIGADDQPRGPRHGDHARGLPRRRTDDAPTCFIAYTIKGFGLPFAGHKDNHAGLMNAGPDGGLPARHGGARGARMGPLRRARRRRSSARALSRPRALCRRAPAAACRRRRCRCPRSLPVPQAAGLSTQEGFGRILNDLAGGDSALASRIVT